MRMSKYTTFLLAVCGLVLVASISSCYTPQKGTQEPNKDSGTKTLEKYNQKPLPEFEFMDQDSQMVNMGTVKGKVHVMDFFFTSCPTICPVMKSNMLTVYEEFEGDERVVMVSHSIDTRNDSVPVLKDYAERLEVGPPLWHFVTGEKENIMGIARDYMVTALDDSLAPGGYAHSGHLVLFDENHDIRGFFDGTSKEETQQLIAAMRELLEEK